MNKTPDQIVAIAYPKFNAAQAAWRENPVGPMPSYGEFLRAAQEAARAEAEAPAPRQSGAATAPAAEPDHHLEEPHLVGES
jgi:hypothetical protein